MLCAQCAFTQVNTKVVEDECVGLGFINSVYFNYLPESMSISAAIYLIKMGP